VLIEKPHRGDFLPILDGGYALQYSPLLEYREGKGLILFCQMDVTGRSEPGAEILAHNIFRYVHSWRPTPRRGVVYTGVADGLEWLEACGIEAAPLRNDPPAEGRVLIVGPGSGDSAERATAIGSWIKGGGRVIALGLEEREANLFLPARIAIQPAEHIAASFSAFSVRSVFAGVAPADLHNRDPRALPLVRGGATVFGGGVLGEAGDVVFLQAPPFLLGVGGSTPLLGRFGTPVESSGGEMKTGRWIEGLYLTRPTEWDDPYRFFRW
jgi:hypothetical protein